MPDQGSPGLDIELLPIPAVLLDREFRIARWNAFCEQLFGYSELEAQGGRMVELVMARLPDTVPEETALAMRERLTAGEIVQHTAQLQARGGEVIWCEFVSQPIIRGGVFSGVLTLFVDVTERIENAERLAASERRLRDMLLNIPMIAGITDGDGRMLLTNQHLAELAGLRDPAELEGQLWVDIFGSYPEDERYWQQLREGQVVDSYEGRVRTVRGERRIVWSNVLLRTDERPLSASIGLDVTDEREARDALMVAQRRLRRLVREVLDAERLERDRIAEDLHDDTIQVLVATLAQMDRVIGRLPDDQLRDLAADARSMLADATDRARRLMFDLHPASLYATGLRSAVSELCHSAASAGGFEVHADVCPGRFSADVEELTFRTIREALANAVKHSGAHVVSVELLDERAALRGSVADDGRGFDTNGDRVHELGRLHLGMSSMSRRVLAVGGDFATESAPGSGTRVRFSVPKTESHSLVS